MRPRGEIREALVAALERLPSEGFTWRDAAQAACVGYEAARVTLRNMALAGELERAGTVAVPHACKPMVRYRPAQGDRADGATALGAAIRSWAEFV